MTKKMSNFKNQLQEYFQVRGLFPLPVYQSSITGGEGHTPLWRSQITLHDGTTYVGEPMRSKKLAEQSAASKALKDLISSSSSIEDGGHRDSTLILVDIENRPNELGKLQSVSHLQNVTIIGITSWLKPKPVIDDSKIHIWEMPSAGQDSADLGMTLLIGRLTYHGKVSRIFLITRDHFGPVVAENVKFFSKDLQMDVFATAEEVIERI